MKIHFFLLLFLVTPNFLPQNLTFLFSKLSLNVNPLIFAEDIPKTNTQNPSSKPEVKPKSDKGATAKTSKPTGRKSKKEFKLADYEMKMQALTACYFIFEKVIEEHKPEFTEFISNYTLNKTEFYTRLRLDHIEKCLLKVSEFNVSRVNSKFFDFRKL